MALFTTTRGLRVEAGDDAGGYYCEHVYYLALRAAAEELAAVLRDEAGDPLVGFLHLPRDQDRPGSATRHQQTAEVVAAALRGWAAVAASCLPEGTQLRLLLTGFGPFRDVTDNPSGDFVRGEEGLTRACALLGGTFAHGEAAVACGPPRGRLSLRLHRHHLAVDATALDGSWASIQGAMARTAPHAVLCLGLGKAATYVAERRATPRDLAAHGGPAAPLDEVRASGALARGVRGGGAWLWRPC